MVVTMVGQMRIPVQAIRIPDRQRQRAKELVQPHETRGMAVDQFMLKRHIPGGKPNQQHRGRQQTEDVPECQRREPAAINGGDQQPRGQFGSPEKPRGEMVNLVALLRM